MHVAFYKIERGDGHVSQSTAEDNSGGAHGVEHWQVHHGILFIVWSSSHHRSSFAQALARIWVPARNKLYVSPRFFEGDTDIDDDGL